jgi:hypothetical protein
LLVKEEEMAAMSKKTRPTLDPATRLELRKLCWETMFGQELVKLTIMDLASLFSGLLDFSSHYNLKYQTKMWSANLLLWETLNSSRLSLKS